MSECNCKNILNLQPQCPVTLNVQPQCNPVVNIEPQSGNTIIMDTAYHNQLLNRDLANQHPISAITNLQNSLDALQDNINQEETERKATDETLADGITELTTSVTTAITNEATARNNADTQIVNTLNDHINNKSNPHLVNKVQVGLGNVDNTSDMNKPISTATQSALNGMVTIATGQTISGAKTFSNTVTMAGQTPIAASHNYNSYAVFQRLPNTREQIFSNGGDKLRLRGSETRPQYNGNDLALYSDVTAEGADLTAHINNKNNPHEVTKAQVGLGNVSNLAPADLPISTATQSALDVVNGDIDNIEELIPNQATSSNQLADKSFVNSSISTNTANFIGTFSSVQDLEDYSGTVTNNDYAFVETTDTAGNTLYDRYKYTDSTNSWQFEYELNNSSFTANQWAAINSGATSTNIGQIATNTNDITSINTTIGGYGNIVTYDVDDFATASQGAKADTAVQPADLATVATTGDYDDLIDKPTIPTDTSDLTNGAGYITGITSSDVTTALGYTPYNSSNPDGYTSNVGTVTSVNNTLPDGDGNVTITIPDPLPSQSGQSGKFLSTDGTNPSWQNVDALPSQTGQAGKYLTTDGTNPSWNTITIPSVDVDGISINRNADDELQTIGVINQNDTTTAIKTWTGTKAQYEAIVTKDANTLYNITDDTDVSLTILEALYPVGSIYITTNAACPLSTLISGSTWELVSSGRVLQGSDSGHSAGTTIEAGLPNITGNFDTLLNGGVKDGNYLSCLTVINTSGAFYREKAANTDWFLASDKITSNQNGHYAGRFSASRSSSIYGRSNTVQPPAYVVNIYRRTA